MASGFAWIRIVARVLSEPASRWHVNSRGVVYTAVDHDSSAGAHPFQPGVPRASPRVWAQRCLTTVMATLALLAEAGRSDAACSLPPAETLGRADLPGQSQVEDDRLVRNFVLFSYRNVADDLINGHGPYLETLRSVFAPACRDEQALHRWLTTLLICSDSAVEFSRRIAAASLHVRRNQPEPGEPS